HAIRLIPADHAVMGLLPQGTRDRLVRAGGARLPHAPSCAGITPPAWPEPSTARVIPARVLGSRRRAAARHAAPVLPSFYVPFQIVVDTTRQKEARFVPGLVCRQRFY